MNQNQISPAQLELLLKMAGKQLHIDPQALRRQLENGDLSALGNQQQQIQQPPGVCGAPRGGHHSSGQACAGA